MKGDFSRNTFNKTRHFKSVRMQQGRVQLDADWNEQQDIVQYRIERGTADIVGGCGGPINGGGFRIVSAITDLPPEEQALEANQNPPTLDGAGDFFIAAGRYYVHGVLCEAEGITAYSAQPNLPLDTLGSGGASPTLPLPAEAGTYIAYLDVWDRHITALEEPHLREVALGGPDTTTRNKIVWQVKLHRLEAGEVAGANCSDEIPSWVNATRPSTGALGARAELTLEDDDPCIVPPGAGFRRLENQLYRVEVHEGGARNNASFKWSRDNGSIVSRLEQQSTDLTRWTVSNPGSDAILRFAVGQWVELTDDNHELLGIPGTLVQVTQVAGDVLTVDLSQRFPTAGSVDMADFPENPKIRRWDGMLTNVTNQTYRDLEDGVQVRIQGGNVDGQPRQYRTGDYWQIPARTLTGEVEWPQDGANPAWQQPFGIQHRYCRLALMTFDGAVWTNISDCRNLFPPLTQVLRFFHVSGDGQEALPGNPVPRPLQVGVSNGQMPVVGAIVQFEVIGGTGTLMATGVDPCTTFTAGGTSTITAITDDDGVASACWLLDDTLHSQQVEATLLGIGDHPLVNATGVSLFTPIRFNANLGLASEVAYTPGAGCVMPASVNTVQEALDELCRMPSAGECVTIAVRPGVGWEGLLATLPPGSDATICLMPGLYPLNRRVELRDFGTIKFTGAGASSRIVVENDEVALWFENCTEVKVRDVYVESLRVGTGRTVGDVFPGLSGALTFNRCDAVTVEDTALKCASGAERMGSCLTVYGNPDRLDTEPGAGTVRIQNCDMRIGHQQAGIVVNSVRRSSITNNLLRPGVKPDSLSMERLLLNKHYRSAVREIILNRVNLDPSEELVGGTPVGFALVSGGGFDALFEVGQPYDAEWERFVQLPEIQTSLKGIQTAQDLYRRLANIVDQILLHQGNYSADVLLPNYAAWYENELRLSNTTTASQGIVIGGREARDVKITGNTILGVHMGIHAGVSDGPFDSNNILSIGKLLIADNEIEAYNTPGMRERHGIFVGNCDSVHVLNNRIRLRRYPAANNLPIDGIRIFGFLGRMVMVRQNHIVEFSTGTRVTPLNISTRTLEQWFVSDNAMENIARAVDAPRLVRRENNVS